MRLFSYRGPGAPRRDLESCHGIARHAQGLFFLASLLASLTFAQTETREQTIDGERYLVLENAHARIGVWPDAGAAITEYTDKRTNTNFATGPTKKGAAGYAWKDVTRLHPADPPSNWMGAKPYETKFLKGTGYQSILATCEAAHLRVEREMRLDDKSTQLTVLIRHTNISEVPKAIWLRWHPYMVLDDVHAKHSFVLIPGPGADEMRKIPVGAGWEAHFMDVPGYWMAANAHTGVGLWMTFRRSDVVINSTWTDYKFQFHPRRGWFTAELFPRPVMVDPGKSIELQCTYQPFSSTDKDESLTMDFLSEPDQAGAKKFVARTRPNLQTIGDHTMVPQPNNGWTASQQNRFFFSHRRRDRFAIADWGIVDAMMGIPGDQSLVVRLRLFANAFDSFEGNMNLRYQLSVIDGQGVLARQQSWSYSINPAEYKRIDMQEKFPLGGLADGLYTFVLEAFEGRATTPMHSYIEKRRLGGTALKAYSERRRKEGPSDLLKTERPFVTALRTIELPKEIFPIPVGIEDASGIERTGWPVRLGIPFPEGKISNGTRLVAYSPAGKPVTTQTDLMGTWPDGSVRWTLIEFPADVPANGHVFYQLKIIDGGPDWGLLAAQTGDTIQIDTGEGGTKMSIPTKGEGALFGLFGTEDIWWSTETDRYFFKLSGEDAGITIEENGPVRAVVKVVGWYFAEGKTEPIARGELRAEFYRGHMAWKLYHTFTYAGNPWADKLASTGIRFHLPAFKNGTLHIELDGKVTSGKMMSLYQGSENTASISEAGKIKVSGIRSTGAVSLEFDNQKTAIYHRNLWQLYPKQIDGNATEGTLTFSYWPEKAGPQDWRPREDGWIPSSSSPEALAVGLSRTHEFVIDPAGSIPLPQFDSVHNEPVIAVVPPRYLCSTRALMHLQPYNPGKATQLENLISETYDSYIINGEAHGWYGEWHYGTVPNVYREDERRWADYGRYANLMNEQDVCHVPWLAFLRSGDRKYYKFAEANTRHLMEVATIRLNPVWAQGVGLSRRHHESIWLGGPDWGHTMLDPFLEMYHVTGYRPAWDASVRCARAMAEQRSGSWRYISNPVAGLARMFLETQIPFYKEQADRIWKELCEPDREAWFDGDHGVRMALYYSQINADCKRLWKEMSDTKEERKPFQFLDSLAALYEQTGDISYATTALKVFRGQAANCQRYDPKRENPMIWSIAMITQHNLAALRQMVYASKAIQDALDLEAKSK